MIAQEVLTKCKSLWAELESFRQFPYRDTTEHLTIGYGRNLEQRGITKPEAVYLMLSDIAYFFEKLLEFKFFENLSDNRKIAVMLIAANVGINGLLSFKKMIMALESEDFERASDEILNSKAAEQAPSRYQKIADMIKNDL